MVKAVDTAIDAEEVCKKVVPNILKDRSIMTIFETKSRGKGTYSARPHTCKQTRWAWSIDGEPDTKVTCFTQSQSRALGSGRPVSIFDC